MSATEHSSSTGFRVVESASGSLRGALAGGVAAFKGIPYGASTSGGNRFLPPQPVARWTGVRDALELGPQSPQSNPDFPVWVDPSIENEDCLVLNVWAPDHAGSTAKLPVMAWLHGGGFVYGSAGAPFYDGGNMALKGDVVVVGINHRLNGFGYTYLGEAVDERFAMSGNAAQLDIVAALRWIKQNIVAFGGDPDNVTVFGQSGGGGKLLTLMAMQEAKGLFHKAIVMSGAPQRFLTPAHGEAVTAKLYRGLGLREGDVEALQAVPTKKLARLLRMLDGTRLDSDGVSSTLKYGPVIDGHVLTEQCWVDGAPELARDIPMIIGTTLHESVGYIGSIPGELAREPSDDQDFARRLASYAVVSKVQAEELVPLMGTYRHVMPSLSHSELLVRISTDIGFWNCSLQLASSKADQGRAPVFAYECAWTTPCFDDKWSLHGVELPFVFNRPRYGVAWDGEDCEALRAGADPNGQRFRVGREMFDAWMAFSHTGSPSTDDLAWPTYDTTSRPTMMFDSSTRVVNDNRGELRPQVTALTSG